MTETKHPGIFVEEVPTGMHPIAGVPTSIAGAVGYLKRGPLNLPVRCLNFGDFQRAFGGLDPDSPTSFQVSQFFLNGGSEIWVSRLCAAAAPAADPDGLPPSGSDVAGDPAASTGIHALDSLPQVDLILVPDMPAMDAPSYLTAAAALLDYALQRRAFALLDLPNDVATPAQAASWATGVPASLGRGIVSAAAYFPRVLVPTPFSPEPMALGASGTMAGIYAASDIGRGVWKAPAGIGARLAGVEALSCKINDGDNGLLNPLGVNALRTFPVYGNVAWGARTLASANSGDWDWKYISVRRLALFIEESLIQGLQWVVFEPNDEALWAQIRLSVSNFLYVLFTQGAFAGASPRDACLCICDATTTTTADILEGVVNIVVMFAPQKPAEFIVLTIQLNTAVPSPGPASGDATTSNVSPPSRA
ncbi:MAG: tail sheath protein [Alphaproteobacteria bacterium]|nr:tail sheath protein [Alphaproteobacteria bacterium]